MTVKKRNYYHICLALLIVVLYGFSVHRANAQSYYFQRSGAEEGLPFVQVEALYQDTKGYLWIGGYGGLSRYDGFSFQNYGPNEGLVNPHVQSISGSDTSGLLLGTSRGLIAFNKKLFTRIAYPGNQNVHAVASIGSTNILVGTDSGLVQITNGRARWLLPFRGIRIYTITHLEQGEWAVGTSSGLWMYENNEWAKFAPLANEKVYAVYQNSGNLLVGTAVGLRIFSNGEQTKIGLLDGLPGIPVTSIIKKNKGAIWIGTPTGMAELKAGKLTLHTVDQYPKSNFIYKLYSDRESNIWVATAYGLYKSSRTGFMNYTYKDGYPGNGTYAITQDEKGELWIATDGVGVYKYNGKSFTSFNTYHGLAGNYVRDVLVNNKKVYVATTSGLSMLKNGRFTTLSKTDGLVSDQIYSLFQSYEGDIVAGGRNGVSIFSDGRMINISLPFKPGYEVWALSDNPEGDVLAGAYQGGLSVIVSSDSVLDFGRKIGLPANNVLALLRDDMHLWIGTFDGVYHYNFGNGELVHINTSNGLNSNLIYSLVLSKDKKELWIGSNQGVNRLLLDSFYRNKKIELRSYGLDDGYIGVESNCHGAFSDSNGTMWFGTANGLIRYDPESNSINSQPALTSIEQIQLFFQDTLLPAGAHLTYNQNHITFVYKGICLTNPDEVKYRFRLVGNSSDWSPATSYREVTFSNLTPGKYRFELIASNNEGVWNKQPVTFDFVIDTPIWMTWWFGALGILLIAIVLWVVIALRMQNIKRKARLQGEMEQLKLKALRSQMNPHFIFNAMNAVQHYINNNEKRSANMFLSKFAMLMRLVLNNSKESTVPLEDDLKALELYMELEKVRFEDNFDFKINLDATVDTWEIMVPPMLVQPFVENAINHGFIGIQRKGKLDISYSVVDNSLQIIISDNGIGRVQAMKNRQANDHLHKPAAMGITNARLEAMSNLYNQKIKAEITDLYDDKQKAAGTRVKLVVPLLFNH